MKTKFTVHLSIAEIKQLESDGMDLIDTLSITRPMKKELLAIKLNDEYFRVELVKEYAKEAKLLINNKIHKANYRRFLFWIGKNCIREMTDEEIIFHNTLLKRKMDKK